MSRGFRAVFLLVIAVLACSPVRHRRVRTPVAPSPVAVIDVTRAFQLSTVRMVR